MENDLAGKPGELRATITVTRAATGKTETYELIGHVQPAQEAESNSDDRNALNSSS